MKKTILLCLFIIGFKMCAFSQNITPLRSDEQCPGVNITFTVTISAKSIQSVQPAAINVNPTVVQAPYNITTSGSNITFNFVGRFADNNNKQTFQILYTDANDLSQVWSATYVKIKSLLTANTFTVISPNISSITAQRCQTQNYSINFSNVQYGNPYESPAIGYGTVTNYEYLLPAGWSINSTTATGGWISSSNNVTITSDLSSGVNGSIRIRPSNAQCASGLATGQEVAIPISRPAPILSVNGANIICSSSSNYSISGLPSGASVCWSISDPSIATIPSTNCSNTIDVTKVADGFVTLSATVTHCAFTYGPFTKQIVLGAPKVLYGSTGVEAFHLTGQNFNYGANGPGNSFSVCPSENLSFTTFFPSGFSSTVFGHSWSISGSYSTVGSLDQPSLDVTSASSPYNNFSFTYQYQNACGWSPLYYGTAGTIDCAGGQEPFRVKFDRGVVEADSVFITGISIYPNPVQDRLIVNLDKRMEGIKIIRLVDATGRTISSQQISGYTTSINFSGLSKGIYYVEINQGKKRVVRKVIK